MDSIVGGQFKKKSEVLQRINELLKVFIRVGETGKEITKDKWVKAVDVECISKVFWQRKMKELHPEKIQSMYDELEILLISKGLKNKPNEK